MAPDEALLIKCHDFDETVARFAPHTAFVDPTVRDVIPRARNEGRTLAIW
jgi:hypothetical protein